VKAAAKAVAASSADAEKQLKGFIDKFESKNQPLVRSLRKALRSGFPVRTNWFGVITTSSLSAIRPRNAPPIPSSRSQRGASGGGLAFYRGASLPDPNKILLGSGSQNRFIRLGSAEMLRRPEVDALIAAAVAQAKTPMAASDKGKLIIRSVSVKQRPRRKSGK
jgi:hypothetical protein